MVAVAHPDADSDRRRVRILRRRRGSRRSRSRAGCRRCRSSPRPGGGCPRTGLQLERGGPPGVLIRVRVAGEDVGREEGRLGRDRGGPLAARGVVGLLAVRAGDREDQPGRHVHAAVGDASECRREVDRARLDRSDRAARPACRNCSEPPPKRIPSFWATSATGPLPTRWQRPDRRDVEGLLQGLADEDRPSLEGCRRPSAPSRCRTGQRCRASRYPA